MKMIHWTIAAGRFAVVFGTALAALNVVWRLPKNSPRTLAVVLAFGAIAAYLLDLASPGLRPAYKRVRLALTAAALASFIAGDVFPSVAQLLHAVAYAILIGVAVISYRVERAVPSRSFPTTDPELHEDALRSPGPA